MNAKQGVIETCKAFDSATYWFLTLNQFILTHTSGQIIVGANSKLVNCSHYWFALIVQSKIAVSYFNLTYIQQSLSKQQFLLGGDLHTKS